MTNTIKNIIIGICLLLFFGVAIDTFTRQRVNKDAPVPEYNASVPLEAEGPWDNRWRRRAMQEDSDPKEMKLYLTKDLQMIWVSNDIADNFGGTKNTSKTTRSESLNYYLALETAYIEIISYANVDFSNINTKHKKNLLLIAKTILSHKAKWLLGKTYKEIMSERLPKDKVRDFCLDDIKVLKKLNNLCIIFNGETINPYYELSVIDQELDSFGLTSKARKDFILTYKPKY